MLRPRLLGCSGVSSGALVVMSDVRSGVRAAQSGVSSGAVTRRQQRNRSPTTQQRNQGKRLWGLQCCIPARIGGKATLANFIWKWAADGAPITVEENLRLWAMVQKAGPIACGATELLLKTAATSVTRKRSGTSATSATSRCIARILLAVREYWAPFGRAHLNSPIRHVNF